eukprot:Skav219759  [mRNA]  locus=scaffold569:250365:251992:- [translate_table: standard]
MSNLDNVIHKFGILDLANASWALARLQQDDVFIFTRLERQLMECSLENATAQQLSNIAWAFSTVGSSRETLAKIAHEAQDRISQFSSQGLANLVWALANQSVECDFFQAVGDHLVLMNLDEQCGGSSDALAAWAVDIAQIIRSFSDLTFCHACVRWSAEALTHVGHELDRRGLRALAPSEELQLQKLPSQSTQLPAPSILWESKDRCVLLKPPGWQVDTEGTEEDFIEDSHAHREMLSQFLVSKYESGSVKHPILTDVKCKNGFLHRLDVPSSGLILVAKKYGAYFDLLMQLHCGELLRDYLVLLHGLADREVVAVRLAKEALSSWSARQLVVKTCVLLCGNLDPGKGRAQKRWIFGSPLTSKTSP